MTTEDPEVVEQYIRSLKWSTEATDEQKTLVAGNLRAFSIWLRETLVTKKCSRCGTAWTGVATPDVCPVCSSLSGAAPMTPADRPPGDAETRDPCREVGLDQPALAPKRRSHMDAPEHIMQFFAFEHLPAHLQDVSRPFGEMAERIVATIQRNPERTVALRKLLEAKDAAVRAVLAHG